MNYTGVIIKESLGDASILDDLHIVETKVEPITPEHKTPWLKQWTLCTVEIPEENVEQVATDMSQSFDTEHPDWYADFKNDKNHYIVFANKVFKVDRNNPILYNNAKKYGMSIGIPEYQLDFKPEEKLWER